jgi:hypothetical protein
MDNLQLNGKDYPFWFALKAQREMSKCKTLVDKDDTYFIWLGLKYGAKKENIGFELTEDGLVDLLEDDLEAYEKACQLLGEQMGKLKKMKSKALEVLQ